MHFRLFIELNNGGVFPFKEDFVNKRHADSGIVAIEERGGINCLDSEGKPAGSLRLNQIAKFHICPTGTDGVAMPQGFKTVQW
jgi:hypothetical protein